MRDETSSDRWNGRLPTNDETPRLSQGAGFRKLVT